MYNTIDWHIQVGDYQLALLASCEIHKSVELLNDVCTIELPAMSYNASLKLEQRLKRGDAVRVRIGYNGQMEDEFSGYLLNVATDDNKVILRCEDDLFLFRKAVKDKQFVGTKMADIAQYLVTQVGVNLSVKCSLDLSYDKFVVVRATAFDVLKKLQEETKANIYIYDGALHIHPPFIEKAGDVAYSFQKNIEAASLKYITKSDRNIEVVVQTTGKDGKRKEVKFGTTGGEQVQISGNGMSEAAMKKIAENEHQRRWFDGYEGDITTWLVPNVLPAFTASIKDEDYEYKDGKYYVTAVTTTISDAGAVRKVQLGQKVV